MAPLLEATREQQVIALDTEADSRHHYREQLCLIQLTIGGRSWIVDPLAGFDMTPLLNLLATRSLILHGADYDLRLLFRAYGFKPVQVFDTMLAAQLLGWPQFSLATLAYAICNVELEKEHQRADWSRRPLTDEMLAYASNDTRHLLRIQRALSIELKFRGRQAWHDQACARLIEAASTGRTERGDDGWRLKGAKNLHGRAGAVLREIWRWREGIAERIDRPPFKVANNDFLIDWARFVAENPTSSFRDLPPRPTWLRGSRLISFERALRTALEMPQSEWPRPGPRSGDRRASKEEEEVVNRLVARRDICATELQLDPGVLAPRDSLKAVVRRSYEGETEVFRDTPLMAWQVELLAPILHPLLPNPQTEDPQALTPNANEI